MIDLKMLEGYEHSSLLLGIADGAEVIRLAMRYLALRECGVTLEPLPDAEWLFNDRLDTATDKLIKELLK